MNKIIPKSIGERRKLISRLASKIAEENQSKSPSSNVQNWLEAEKIVDQEVFSLAKSPQEFYQSIMLKFLSYHDLDHISDEELANRYFSFLYENATLFDVKTRLSTEFLGMRNISLLTAGSDLDFLTKRSLLLAHTTLFGHSLETEKKVFKRTGTTYVDHTCYAYCPDPAKIGKWIKSCKLLIENGELIYVPHLEEHLEEWANGFPSYSDVEGSNYVYDALIQSRSVVQRTMGTKLKYDFIRSIVTIDLPFIDDVGLDEISKITLDERQSVESFRDFIRENFLELIDKEGDEHYEQGLERIAIKIRQGVRALNSDIRNLSSKSALQATGATIGTAVASLVAIDSTIFNTITTIAGTSGGLMVLLNTINDHLSKKRQFRDNPFYYFWIISNVKKRN